MGPRAIRLSIPSQCVSVRVGVAGMCVARYGDLTMFRVTLVTPDEQLLGNLTPPLQADDLEVVALPRVREGEDQDPAAAPDILVLDLRETGPAARSSLREVWPEALVLGIVTPAQPPQLDLTTGLDDFIVAPFESSEFLARVHQLLWRHGRAAARNTIAAGDLVMDVANYQVVEAGRTLTLTYKEYELLRFLMAHAGSVINRETLLNRVWGYDYYGGSRTVDVHIRRLRSKLDGARHTYIETVRNVGYRFTQPLR